MSNLENQKTLPLPEDSGNISPLAAVRESLKNPHVRLAIGALALTGLAVAYQSITEPTNEVPAGVSITEASEEDIILERDVANMIGIDIAGFNFTDTNNQPVTVTCHYRTAPIAEAMTFNDVLAESVASVYPSTYNVVPKETVEIIAAQVNTTTPEGYMAVIHSCGAKPQGAIGP